MARAGCVTADCDGAVSALEEQFAFAIKAVGLPVPVRELRFDWCCERPRKEHTNLTLHLFHRGRDFRFDFAWPDHMLAVEIEGGTATGGRHVRPAGFERDAEKRNLAQLKGWCVLAFTRRMVTSGEALVLVERVLGVDAALPHHAVTDTFGGVRAAPHDPADGYRYPRSKRRMSK